MKSKSSCLGVTVISFLILFNISFFCSADDHLEWDILGLGSDPGDLDALYEMGKQWREESRASTLAPLILIPGLTASNLNAALSSASSPLLCPKNHGYQLLWLETEDLARPDCFFYNLGINYDASSKTYSNNPGVTIQPVDFGGVSGISYLAYLLGKPVEKSAYLLSLITQLEGAGYVVGKNLAGAPYDWRQTANPSGWNDQIKTLIEDMYANNSNTKVWIMAHSMGNLEFTSFLNVMEQSWKDQYIGGYFAAAGPWSGASLALRALISGFKIGLIDPFRVASEIRSFGSIVWMLPDIEMGTGPLVTVNDTTHYSILNFDDLFLDIGAQVTYELYQDLRGEVVSMPNPNVPMYCIYGTNKETEYSYEYGNGLFNLPTNITYENDGDGVVPLVSLEKCQSYNPIETKIFNLLSHGDLVKDPLFFHYIMGIMNPAN